MKKRIACILVIALMILAGYVGLQLRNREDARQFDLNSMTLREAYETARDYSGALGGFADANHMGFEATVSLMMLPVWKTTLRVTARPSPIADALPTMIW